MAEIGPVHRHQDILQVADLAWHPAGKTVPHVDAAIAHQPVFLLDRVLGHQAPCLRQSLADHCHSQRRARHDTQRRTRQRINPPGVQAGSIQPANDAPDLTQTPLERSAPAMPQTPLPMMRRFYRIQPNQGYTLLSNNEGMREGLARRLALIILQRHLQAAFGVADAEALLYRADTPNSKVIIAADCAADEQFLYRGTVRINNDPLSGDVLHAGNVPHFSIEAGASNLAG